MDSFSVLILPTQNMGRFSIFTYLLKVLSLVSESFHYKSFTSEVLTPRYSIFEEIMNDLVCIPDFFLGIFALHIEGLLIFVC